MNEQTEQANVTAGSSAVADAKTQGESLPAPHVLTPDELSQLKDQASKAAENWERLLRLSADFDNYKKRAAREKQDAIKYANQDLLAKLIPILDTFEMALTAASADSGSAQSLRSGIAMIQTQLKNTLVEAGLEEIDAAGKVFDPNFHEAVAQKETDDLPEGHVVQQMRKGYKFRDRLVRAATVVVAKKPAH
jgi:molecular chaperone GrpE